MGYYPPRVLVAEARRFGVPILPLDINRSFGRFTVEDGAIRISLKQLKGMSEEAVDSILSARARAEFTLLEDFILRTDVSQPIVENLVKAGAFDSFGYRDALLLQIPALLKLRHRNGSALKALFPEVEPHKATDTVYCGRTKMLIERELLSLDLSAHPLDFYEKNGDFTHIKDLKSIDTGETVKIAGSVIRYQTPPTRNGNRVVYIILEDGTGVADVTMFSDVQEKCGSILFREGWLVVEGKIQRRGPKSLSIIASNLQKLELS